MTSFKILGTTFIAPDEKRFIYAVEDEFLIIKTNFNVMKYLKFFECKVTKVTGILFLEAIGKNDMGFGYVVYSISKQINKESIFEELEETLKNQFT